MAAAKKKSRPTTTSTGKAAAGRAAATKRVAAKKPVKKVARVSAAKKAAKKTAAKKTAKAPAKKKAVAKKPAAKKTAATKKSAAAKKTAAKKTAAKKTVAKKTAPTKKAAAKKPAAKKASAKKASAKAAATPAAAPKKVAAPEKKAPPKPKKLRIPKFLTDEAWIKSQVELLNEERAKYTRSAEHLAAEAASLMADRDPGDVQFDEESGEGDTIAVERDRDLALSASARNSVAEIDDALKRIEAGTYGICIQGPDIIPKERLEAIPEASVCVQHKTAMF